jgi:hypothetical protein
MIEWFGTGFIEALLIQAGALTSLSHQRLRQSLGR